MIMSELHDRWVSKMLQEKRELKEEKQELLKQNQIMWNALDYIIVATDDYKEKSYGVVLALMALDYKPHETKRAMREQYERIENLFNGFYADDLKVKGE